MSCTEKPELVNFDKLWNYSDPVATRDAFLQLGNEGDEAYQLELKTQIARTYSLEGDFKSAHTVLDAVAQRLGKYPLVDVRYHLERGRTFNSAGEREKALEEFHAAFDLSEANGFEYHTVDAAHMVGLAETDPQVRESWNLKGLELAEAATDPRARGWAGALANNMGWDKFDAGDYDAALDLFERSRRSYEEQDRPINEQIARWSKAKTWRMQGKVNEALEEQLRQEAEHEEAGTIGGYVFEELGELYLMKGEPDKAKGYFAKAYNEISKDDWMMKNESERMARMKQLGGL